MLGKNALGKYIFGRLGNTLQAFTDALDIGFELESFSPETFRLKTKVNNTTLGRNVLGQYILAGNLLSINSVFMETEIDNIPSFTQNHFLNVNEASFALYLGCILPRQTQYPIVYGLETENEFGEIVANQIHNVQSDNFECGLEFQSLEQIVSSSLQIDHVFSDIIPLQIQNVSVIDNLGIFNDLAAIIPQQIHDVTNILGATFENSLESLEVSQIQNLSVNNFIAGHEFQSIESFIDKVILGLEFRGIVPTQDHNITTNNLNIENEFEQCLPVQIHVVSTTDLSFANVFSGFDAMQIHILQPRNMQFNLTSNKIFPETIVGGYLFITIDDDGTMYNLSFEGIETE